MATESTSAYGRGIFRGVVRYTNLQRNWILHKDMWRVDPADWPMCDGIIIGGLTRNDIQLIQRHGRHFVSCSGNQDASEMPVVCLDDMEAGRMIASHLIDRGFKQFAYYRDPGDDQMRLPRPLYTFARRSEGFRRSVEERGFVCHGSDVVPSYTDFLSLAHHPRLIKWLQSLPKPIGILAVDDTYAHDLAVACRAAEISVPDSVAIVGVNNDDLLCESAWPPLSSVECDFARMGYLAAKTLDRLLKGEKITQAERLVELPPVRVEQRMSSDVLAIDHAEVADAIRYIRLHACDPCTVKDVLRVVPVSRRTLERQFSSLMGRSLHDEIARVRSETAKRLLVQPDLSIEDVSRRCGFTTLSSFGRFFHDAVATSPAAYRRQIARPPGSTGR